MKKNVVVKTNSYDMNCLSLTEKKIEKLEKCLERDQKVIIEIDSYPTIEDKKKGKNRTTTIVEVKHFRKLGVRKYNRGDMSKTLYRIKFNEPLKLLNKKYVNNIIDKILVEFQTLINPLYKEVV